MSGNWLGSHQGAGESRDPRTPPCERISLSFAPGDDSDPLISDEYALASMVQPDPATADALRSVPVWATAETGGNGGKDLNPVGLIPLPDVIRGQGEARITQIT
jgi:hypothetical protein